MEGREGKDGSYALESVRESRKERFLIYRDSFAESERDRLRRWQQERPRPRLVTLPVLQPNQPRGSRRVVKPKHSLAELSRQKEEIWKNCEVGIGQGSLAPSLHIDRLVRKIPNEVKCYLSNDTFTRYATMIRLCRADEREEEASEVERKPQMQFV